MWSDANELVGIPNGRVESVYRLEGLFHDNGYVVKHKKVPNEEMVEVYRLGQNVNRFVAFFGVKRKDEYLGTVHIDKSSGNGEVWTFEAGIKDANELARIANPLKEEYNAKTRLREIR
jgi:hypothetical protein